MYIKALKTVFVRGQGQYEKGKEYDVTDAVGEMLVKRAQAEKARKPKEEKEEPATKKKSK